MIRWIKLSIILSTITVVLSACGSEQIDPIPKVKHLAIDELYDHIPIDEFEKNSSAIFRDSIGNEINFNLTVGESVSGNNSELNPITFNQISLIYESVMDSSILVMSISATFREIPDLGFIEFLNCKISSLESIENLQLEIILGSNYKNTILLDEFEWLGETYTNVYANECITIDNNITHKIYYKSPVGILAFTDQIGNPFIFDRFE